MRAERRREALRGRTGASENPEEAPIQEARTESFGPCSFPGRNNRHLGITALSPSASITWDLEVFVCSLQMLLHVCEMSGDTVEEFVEGPHRRANIVKK